MGSTVTEAGRLWAERGEEALEAGNYRSAIAYFDQAEPEVEDPDRCAGGRWLAYMMLGDFESAWRESDSIRRRGRPDPHRFWNGESFRGRDVMVRSLHGFGDAVQMARFLPRLQKQARSVVLEVAPRLLPLARSFPGVDRVITWGANAPAEPPAWEVQIEITELPYALRVTAEDLQPTHGYLRLEEEARAVAQEVIGRERSLRVGLVWSAGEWNQTRSVPFELFEDSLLGVADVSFWSLQGEPARTRWKAKNMGKRCRDSFACGDGLVPMAATIAELDLLITVDTLAAHLAGALEVPCWLLLQQRADWRWMADRKDTPWYPSLRLWRQSQQGEWSELMTRVGAELARWAKAGSKQ